MKVDFETIAAVISLLFNAGGVAFLAWLLEKKDLEDLQNELAKEIKTKTSDPGFIFLKKKKLCLVLIPIVLMHIVNLVLLLAIITVLIVGPENLPSNLMTGTIAEPLTILEKIIYSFFLIVVVLGYVFRCVFPTYQLIMLKTKAKNWLKKNDPNRTKS